MTRLNRIKRIFLTGVVAASMIASSLTAFAADAGTTVPSVKESENGSVTFPVSQTWNLNGVSAKDLNSDDLKVTYTITQAEDEYNDGQETVSPETFDLTGDESQDITIKATHAGVYTFTLAPTAKTTLTGGYTYATNVYTIRAYVKNDGKGGLSTYLTAETNGKKVDQITFANTFLPAHSDDETNDPPVVKTVEGSKPADSDEFTFTIEADAANPTKAMPADTTITIRPSVNNTAEFGNITFLKEGTYTYYVKETAGDLKGYTYDKTVYTVIYKVTTNADNKLVSTRTFLKDDAEIETPAKDFSYEFVNTKKSSGGGGDDGHHGGDGYGSVVVYKVDAASDNTRLSGVRFEVTKTNGDYVTTITTDDKGMAAINSLPVATYRLKELNTPNGYQAENRYIYFTVIKDTTVASPTNVKVTNTKATENQHIVAVKQWANVDGVAIPDSVTFELTKDGVGTGVTQVASAANNWTVDFGLVPADGIYDIVETNVPDGYAVSYEKAVNGQDVVYTITNTNTEESGAAGDHQNAYTGDSSNMMLYAGVMGAAIICLAGWFVVNKRTR